MQDSLRSVDTTETWMRDMYAAFNRRDVDSVFARMGETVSWPTASEGGRVVGKQEIRAYWTRQWAEFDPHVEPLEIIERAEGRVDVKVRQLVRTPDGLILSDQMVGHTYTITDGLIERMDIIAEESGFALPDPR